MIRVCTGCGRPKEADGTIRHTEECANEAIKGKREWTIPVEEGIDALRVLAGRADTCRSLRG